MALDDYCSVMKLDICTRKACLTTLPSFNPTGIKRKGIEALFGGTAEKAYIKWPEIGVFLAEGGKTLTADVESENLPEEVLNLFLYSEALGLILFQKGYFLLHASAVYANNKAVVFAGDPGTGKSSLAAAYYAAGAQIIADDMVAMDVSNLLVLPGVANIKLWPQTIHGLHLSSGLLQPLFPGSEKKVIPNASVPHPVPLGEIYILSRALTYNKQRLEGAEAISMLLRYFPCPPALLQGEYAKRHFEQCVFLAGNIPLWKLEMPENFSTLRAFVRESLISQ